MTDATLQAQYPFLEVTASGSWSSVLTAARNIRHLLSRQWPRVKFRVTCQRYAGGNSVFVELWRSKLRLLLRN